MTHLLEQIVANAEAAIDAVVKMGFATSNAWCGRAQLRSVYGGDVAGQQ